MKLLEFNREKGVYNFEVENITSEFHAHPAVEILYSESGRMQIETAASVFHEVSFAVIPANMRHRIISENEPTNVLLMECNPGLLQKQLVAEQIELVNGVYVETKRRNRRELMKKLTRWVLQNEVPITLHNEILVCLDYLNSTSSDYKQMMTVLKSSINLSESRLSHMFKEEMGISLKKYLVWCRLKRAFQGVVEGRVNMYHAALESGFYDQAHLSRAFKQLLGIRPSIVYNSRTVQNLTGE